MRTGRGTDPWYVEEFGIPIIPIDQFDLTHNNRRLEILGRSVEISDNLLRMDAHLWPVPMMRPLRDPEGRGLPYRTNRTIGPLAPSRRRELRRAWGVGSAERLLMIPTLPWQHTMRTRAGPLTRELARRVPPLITDYLLKLPPATHFMIIGPMFEEFRALPTPRLHHLFPYTTAQYSEAIGASDGVFALSPQSWALERAVLADVPGMFTLNTLDLGEGPTRLERAAAALGALTPTVEKWLADFPEPLPPFRSWPLKWNDIIEPLLRDNPFSETVLSTELFDEPTVVTHLERLLYDPSVRATLATARATYHTLLDRLPPTTEVFMTAAARVGLRAA